MATSDKNIRREISRKFRLAIDCEENGNNTVAYINYLDGLSLVVSALKEDCMSASGLLSTSEKKSLLGFAKQSVDRLLLILETPVTLEVEKNLDEILDMNNDADSIATNLTEPERVYDLNGGLNGSWMMPVVFEESTMPVVSSPLVELLKENSILTARYNKRMRIAPNDYERQNLQLELERRLVENSAIAARRQVVWARQRDKVTVRFKQLAQQKFGDIKDGQVQDVELRKQEIFTASLQYAMDNIRLESLQQEFSKDAGNTTLARSLVSCMLSDCKHPVGNMLREMQLEISKKISTVPDGCIEADAIEHRTHFKTISNEIKSNITTLDTLIKAIYEQLSCDIHLNIVTELIHYFYFGPLKIDLIGLLRICTKETEEILQNEMNSGDVTDSMQFDENTKNVTVSNLKKMLAHHSPCGMLDCLVAVIKSIACKDNAACNSLGADDLLPRLIGVVLSSREHCLPAHTLFMESFMPSYKALSEEGYSLTLLQSVIVCITTKQT